MRAVVVATMVLGSACADAGPSRDDGAATIGDASTDDGDADTGGTASTGTSADGSSSTTTGGGGSESESGSTGADTQVPGAWCEAIPSCLAPLPDPGPMLEWEHTESSLVVASGGPTHRGRDMFFHADEPQWVLGKFAYGPTDYDLEDEQVDLYLLRECTGEWESLGSVHTTWEGSHADVEGIADTGGRVYFELPADAKLGPGRHRIHMIVRGDLTRADQYIEVVPAGTPVVLTDVDGTLTTSENEEFFDLLSGTLPEVRPGAPAALQALAAKGYHPIYLTARPEFLGTRTQEFVRERGLPPGIVHTSLNFDGALGSAAVAFKTAELEAFAARGIVPTFVFGNTQSDGDAYENAGIQPLDHRVFIEFDDAHGGRRIDSWDAIVAELEALPDLCE